MMIENDPRSPDVISLDVLQVLYDMWVERVAHPEGLNAFLELVVHPLWDNGTTGAEHQETLAAYLADPISHQDGRALQLAVEVCTAFVCEVNWLQRNSHFDLAWQRLAEAKFWLGVVTTEWFHVKAESDAEPEANTAASLAGKTLSELGTDARHAENRVLRADLTKWFDEHESQYPNLTAAARAAEKVVPVKFSTAYSWLRHHHKTRGRKLS